MEITDNNKNKSISSLKMIFIILIFLAFVYLIIVILGSYLNEGPGYSVSIKNSKDNKVFIAQYNLLGDSIHFDKNVSIKAGEIWVERLWTQGNIFHPVILSTEENPYSNYGLYIEIPKDQLNKLENFLGKYIDKASVLNSEKTFMWQRGADNKTFLYVNYAKLPSQKEKFTVLERTDTLNVELIPQKWINPKIVGTFIIERK